MLTFRNPARPPQSCCSHQRPRQTVDCLEDDENENVEHVEHVRTERSIINGGKKVQTYMSLCELVFDGLLVDFTAFLFFFFHFDLQAV